MRDQAAGVLLLLNGLFSLWLGCSHQPPCPPPVTHVAAGGACVRDTDCRSGFCDRDICMDVFELPGIGKECDRDPPVDAPVDGPNAGRSDRGCGRYLCLDGRCRSCASDAECQTHSMGGKCVPMNPRFPTLTWCADVGGTGGILQYPAPPPPPSAAPAPSR